MCLDSGVNEKCRFLFLLNNYFWTFYFYEEYFRTIEYFAHNFSTLVFTREILQN